MTSEQITQEWLDGLSGSKLEIAMRLKFPHDFLVTGDAMSFIEEIAPAYGYNIVYMKLKTLDDLRGTPVVKHNERLGRNYFDYDLNWMNAVESSEQKSLVIFNIDEADDRLVSGIKSFIEHRGDKYFVGIICTDKTRDLERTTTYDLVKPVISYD